MMTINRDQNEKKKQMKLDQDFKEYLKISHDYHKVLQEQEKIFYFIEKVDQNMKDNKRRIDSAQLTATRYLDPLYIKLTDEQYNKHLQEKEIQNQQALVRLEERKQKYQIYEQLKQKYLKQMEEKRAQMEKNSKKMNLPKPLPKMNNPPQKQKNKGSFFFMSNSAQPSHQTRQVPQKNTVDDYKLEMENHCVKCQNKIKELRNQKIKYKEYLLGEKMDDQKLEYILAKAETFHNLEDVDKIEDEQDLIKCGCDCVKCNPGVPKIQLRNRRLENKFRNSEIRSQSMPKFMLFKTVKGGNQPFIKINMEHLREQQEKFIQSRHPSKKSIDQRQWKY